jgi:prepilin-type N-terminal cleavage/methylation domain-containing protein
MTAESKLPLRLISGCDFAAWVRWAIVAPQCVESVSTAACAVVACGGRSNLRRSPAGLRRGQAAFSLVELLIVVVLVSILAEVAITNATTNIYEQLQSVASILAGDLSYARSLAVGNNSTYCFTLDTTGNRLVMTNTGSDPTLATLPKSPFRSPTDPSNQYIVALSTFPNLGMPVKLLGAQAVGSGTQNITTVEFGPYGSTTQANQTVIWLTAGAGTGRRYTSISVNPVTGLSTVGSYTSTAPSGMTIPTP